MVLRLELAAKESGDRSKEAHITLANFIYKHIYKDCTKKLSRSCRCCLLLLLRKTLIIYISTLLVFVHHPITVLFRASTMRFSRLVVFLFLVLFYHFIFVSQGKSDTTEMLVGSARPSVNVVISLSLSRHVFSNIFYQNFDNGYDRSILQGRGECSEGAVECKEGNGRSEENVLEDEDYIYTNSLP